eukprot:364438-Chlamydomonas_euryale.AAC.2
MHGHTEAPMRCAPAPPSSCGCDVLPAWTRACRENSGIAVCVHARPGRPDWERMAVRPLGAAMMCCLHAWTCACKQTMPGLYVYACASRAVAVRPSGWRGCRAGHQRGRQLCVGGGRGYVFTRFPRHAL